MTTFSPRSADEVADAIRWALAAGDAFEVICGGSKRALGRPVGAAHRLDVSAISGIVNYDPAELILTARPGTSMDLIEASLAEHAQCLAFEPPELGPVLGELNAADPSNGPIAKGTLGGAIATALSGPRRVKAGAARDHVLGIAAVSGRGEVFVGGGKVVKNVTGYDIPKLMTGSHGTLAVLTEITLKVLPAAEDVRTLLVHGLGTQDAVNAMTGVLQSAVDASGACHLPAELVPAEIALDGSITAFRLEGFRPSVEFRLTRLREPLERAGSLTLLDRDTSIEFWRGVRDVAPFIDSGSRGELRSAAGSGSGDSEPSHLAIRGAAAGSVWRLSVPPAQGANVIGRISRSVPGAQAFLDWGGGLIWVQLPPTAGESRVAGPDSTRDSSSDGAHALAIRAAIGDTGGHATLIRAPAEARSAVEVFHPQPAALAALSRRVKAQFDPSRVLNPGRMYADV